MIMKLSKLFVINTNYKTVFNYFNDLGAFWVQLFWGVNYYLLRLTDITISLNYSLNLAGALGALGRRFEACRPDQL